MPFPAAMWAKNRISVYIQMALYGLETSFLGQPERGVAVGVEAVLALNSLAVNLLHAR